MHLRETLEELNALETAFNKSAFAQFTYPGPIRMSALSS